MPIYYHMHKRGSYSLNDVKEYSAIERIFLLVRGIVEDCILCAWSWPWGTRGEGGGEGRQGACSLLIILILERRNIQQNAGSCFVLAKNFTAHANITEGSICGNISWTCHTTQPENSTPCWTIAFERFCQSKLLSSKVWYMCRWHSCCLSISTSGLLVCPTPPLCTSYSIGPSSSPACTI